MKYVVPPLSAIIPRKRLNGDGPGLSSTHAAMPTANATKPATNQKTWTSAGLGFAWVTIKTPSTNTTAPPIASRRMACSNSGLGAAASISVQPTLLNHRDPAIFLSAFTSRSWYAIGGAAGTTQKTCQHPY